MFLAASTSTEHFLAIIALLTLIFGAGGALARFMWSALKIGREQIDATHENTQAIGELGNRVHALEQSHRRRWWW
jgi:hypothetical protein